MAGNRNVASVPVLRVFDLMRFMVENQEFYRGLGGIPTEIILQKFYGENNSSNKKLFLRDRSIISTCFGDAFKKVSKRKKKTKPSTPEDGVTRWLFEEPWKNWGVKSPVTLKAFPELVWNQEKQCMVKEEVR